MNLAEAVNSYYIEKPLYGPYVIDQRSIMMALLTSLNQDSCREAISK